jgi:type I restriction enzyme S subunit
MEVLQDTYKDTKIGRIPKDWKLISFGDLGEYYGGLSGKTKVNFGSGKPYIPFMNIMANDIIDVNYFDLVEIKGDEKQNKAVKGDVFFNTSSETPEEVGMCAVLLDDISDLYLNSFCFGFRLNEEAKKRYLPEYISRFMNSGFGRRLMFPLAQGMTRYNLSKKYFVKLEIPFPSLPEQQKIAAILSTVDEQISTTDKIIEKSKELKKGLMQKLFSEGIGHTEFKDTKIGRIPKKWEVRNLNKCCDINKDSLSSSTKEDYSFYYLDLSLVKKGIIDFPNAKVDFKNAPSRARRKIKKGDILMSTVRPNLLGNGYINFDSEEYIASTGFAVLSNYKETNGEFLYHYLYSHNMQSQIERMLVGSSYPAINNKDVSILKIPFPLLKEQQKIATILSEIDAKIEKEQTQKKQLEHLKKGLMQQLLTGKKRVKV